MRIDDVDRCYDLGNNIYLCSDDCLVDFLCKRQPWWSESDSQQYIKILHKPNNKKEVN